MKPKLKICGLMRKEDVTMCCNLGVDICGFVVEYPIAVPWNLTREQCAALLPSISADAKSCIVTGGACERIISLALELKPNFVQLHYHETLNDTAAITRALSPYGIGVIKTIPSKKEDRLQQFGTDDAGTCAKLLCSVGVYAVLVDGRESTNAAGIGTKADLSLFAEVSNAVSCPVMLGGGITQKNCHELLKCVTPDIIDIMTGVESAPGIKSEEKTSELIDSMRLAVDKLRTIAV